MPAFPPSITVIARTKGSHPNARPGVEVVHRTLADEDIEIVQGVSTTGVALTVLDVAAEDGSQVADNALLTRRVTLGELEDTHRRYPGRTGAGVTREILRALGSGARSEAERICTAIFDGAGITGWIANHEVAGHLFDFVFPRPKLIVEIDGFAFHRDAATFQRDRTKRNEMLGLGWTMLNFTWDDITRRPADVAARVASAAATSGASGDRAIWVWPADSLHLNGCLRSGSSRRAHIHN